LAALALGLAAACRAAPPPKQYALTGQVLAVHTDPPRLTVRHDDIEGLMPGMTMTFEVRPASLLSGRTAGELVRATLEVTDATGVLVAITHVGLAPVPDSPAGALAAGLLETGDVVPDTALIDQDDRRRPFSEWRGHLTVVTFTYTRCPLPAFCPLMDQNFATLQRAIAEDGRLRGRVRLVSVTVDPDFDTPAVLRAHAARRRADPAVWTFLTGDRLTVERFAARFGVSVLRESPAAADITHNLRTAIVGPDGRVRQIHTGNAWTPGSLLANLRDALRQP